MIIFKDAIADYDDEIISDSYDLKEIHGGVAYEADCAMIDIGAVDVNIGANASAEEADEALDDQSQKVNNIIHSFRLQQTSFDEKSYKSYLGKYLKAVEAYMKENNKPEEEIANMKKNSMELFKKIKTNFKDYEFYIGENMDPKGIVVLLNYREDGITPYVTVWRYGLKEMKV